MPTVRVGDINIYYEIHGEGEPLVHISGGGATVEWSHEMIPTYANEFRLVLFDNRGAGKTDVPDAPFTIEIMADDVDGLLDVINIKSAHVVGASTGGMVAQQFAIRHPEKVMSLVLVSTYCGDTHGIPMNTEPIRLSDNVLTRKTDHLEAERALFSICFTQEFIKNNPGFIDNMMEFVKVRPLFTRGMAMQLQAIKMHDTYELLPKITAPSLIIAGDADEVIPVENARILASRIPDAELVILKNAGHMLIEAGPEKDKTILDFLRRHKS